MVRCRSKAKISASKLSPKDDVPAETTPVETDLSKPVMVDIPESTKTVSQIKNEMQTANIEAKENEVDAAEEEIMVEQAAEGLGGVEVGEEGYSDDDVNVGDEDDYRDDDDVNVGDENDYDDGDNDEEDDCDDSHVDGDDYGEEDIMGVEDDYRVDGDYGKEDMMEEELGEYAKEETKDNNAQEDEDHQKNTVEEEIKEETGKEKNEKRSLKQKVKASRKGSERKKVKKGSSNKVASKGEDNQEKGGQEDAMEEEDAKEEPERKGQGSSMLKVKELRERSRRKKVTTGGFEKVAIKQDDKPEFQRKKKSTKKVASMGMIFMCSSKTKVDCYHYKVLGLPASKRDIVGKIYKGMRLFLYDVDLKLMYGIYKAAGHGGYNIQPKAFNSQFPSQVRFTVLEDCLPLAEEKFKKIIKDNYFTKTKFDCQLTSVQVKNLCKLFLAASKGPKSRKLGRNLRAPNRTERRSALEESQYHEYPRRREREVVLRLPPLSPQATSPSYLYGRTLEMDAYIQDNHREPVLEPRDAYRPPPILEHRDVDRQEPLSSYHDSYRRDVVVEHGDPLSRDEIGRYDPYIYYRERPERRDRWSRDETRRHTPYISYRERAAYRDPLYARGPLPERGHYRPIGQSPEYRSAVAPERDYHSSRSLYRY